MSDLKQVADKHGLALIEDAAHAFGGTYLPGGHSSAIGDCSLSEMTIFSFHPTKNITTGEGGAITTCKADLFERLRRLRSHAFTYDAALFEAGSPGLDSHGSRLPWYYEAQEVGFNYRLPEASAALGISQLGRLEQFRERRAELKHAYDQSLKPFAHMIGTANTTSNCLPMWHLYRVLLDFPKTKINRADLMNQLARRRIGTQVHYIPLYYHPPYRDSHNGTCLPGAEFYYAHTLSLPLHVNLTRDDIGYVVANLAELLGLQ